MIETQHVPPGWGDSGVIVVVPARNEASRLPTALAALARDGVVQDVMVIANGCTDDTAAIARSFPAALRIAVVETGPLRGGVGEARRIGMRATMAVAPHAAILASTDADCLVAPGWGATTLAALERAEAVCGRVIPEPQEFSQLPEIVRRHGALEEYVDALIAELDGLRAPAVHDPLPRHNQTPGASLAIRSGAYMRAGGFEPIPCHEDRRLVARIELAGGRIARPWALTVTASCRVRGRAPGGMADTIAARAADPALLHREIVRMQSEVVRLETSIAAHRNTYSRRISLPASLSLLETLSSSLSHLESVRCETPPWSNPGSETASGVRNSCAASATNRRCRSSTS